MTTLAVLLVSYAGLGPVQSAEPWPVRILVCQEGKGPKFAEIPDEGLEAWAEKRSMTLVKLKDPEAEVLFSDEVAPLKSLELARVFYEEGLGSVGSAFSGDGKFGAMVKDFFEANHLSDLSETGDAKNFGLGLSIELTIGGKVTDAGRTTFRPQFERAGSPPAAPSHPAAKRHEGKPNIQNTMLNRSAWHVTVDPRNPVTKVEQSRMVAEAWAIVAKEMEDKVRYAHAAHRELFNKLVEAYAPGLVGKVPGIVTYRDMPQFMKDKLMNQATVFPGMLGFASSAEAKQWLESNPQFGINAEAQLSHLAGYDAKNDVRYFDTSILQGPRG